jgi:hypothetical protein
MFHLQHFRKNILTVLKLRPTDFVANVDDIHIIQTHGESSGFVKSRYFLQAIFFNLKILFFWDVKTLESSLKPPQQPRISKILIQY